MVDIKLGKLAKLGIGAALFAGASACAGLFGADDDLQPAKPDAGPDAKVDGAPATGGDGGDGGISVGDQGPPSCIGLPKECGGAGASSRDCCDSPPVAGGRFFRSFDNVADAGGHDAGFPASVASYRLDRYEVTVARYRAFLKAYSPTVAAGSGKNPNNPLDTGWSEDWNASLPFDFPTAVSRMKACVSTPEPQVKAAPTWTDEPGANEHTPINCVTWYEAFAFCIWDGGRLPTEAEWNYAASHGSDHRVYAWKSSLLTDIDPQHAVYESETMLRVGSRSPAGDSEWGQTDMVGNAFEWVVDWWRKEYATSDCDNCAQLKNDGTLFYRGLRGGAFYNVAHKASAPLPESYLRNAIRGSADPKSRNNGYGFRCARAAK